jgi:CPA1 family monovalent cation:H+ antiporter
VDSSSILEAEWLFVGLVAIAAIVALLTRRTNLPYSVALVLAGLALAALVPGADIEVSPEVILTLLLPGLVFEAALKTDLGHLRPSVGAVTLLAVPGVLITAAFVTVILHLATGLDLSLALVIGAMISATDPVAVIAIFRRVGAPSRLVALVEAESLFNDGTGIVLFAIAVGAVSTPLDLGAGAVAFVMTIVVSGAFGAVAGFLASRIIATVDDHLVELTISLLAAYGTYLVAGYFHESGVIATVVAGIVIGSYGRRIGMSARTEEALDTVWEFLAFLLTALTFLLVGLAISPGQLADAAWYIAWAFVAVTIGRAVVVYGLLGGASLLLRRDERIPTAWLHVVFWAGLRGAVATALALSLPLDLPQRDLLAGTVFGVVVLTLLIQGTTAWMVIRRAGVVEGSP